MTDVTFLQIRNLEKENGEYGDGDFTDLIFMDALIVN